MTDFILLTGFLGAGKTTLLRDFLAQPESADTAVIMNEAGAIDIDGAVVAEDKTGLPMAMLANGCVCCSIANDLLYTIEALIASRETPFRRIVLETSGLAMPGPIIRSLGELGPLGMRVRVVAACDAAAPVFAREGFETAAAQVAAAGIIVLTKLDRATDPAVVGTLTAANPLAAVVQEATPSRRALLAFTAEAAAPAIPPAGDISGHPRISVMLGQPGQASVETLLEWLENLSGLLGERLLRLKGVVQPADMAERVLVQAVGSTFDPPRRFMGAAETGLVLIARDTTAAEVLALQPDIGLTLQTQTAGPFGGPAARRLVAD